MLALLCFCVATVFSVNRDLYNTAPSLDVKIPLNILVQCKNTYAVSGIAAVRLSSS